jgi:2-polyprenyl-3-methyl-5-hydroxy-6-metoxy-1,4-benzoquinol methylase
VSYQDELNQLFNRNSQKFSDAIESRFREGTYRRGQIFLSRVTALLEPAGKSVLDFGCGTGRISMMLGQAGYRVLGVDPAVEHINAALSHNELPNVEFKVLSDQLPIESPLTFDAVVSSSVFEFVPDPRQYVSVIHTVLRSAGLLFISFPNLCSLWRLYAKVRFGRTYEHFSFQKNLLGLNAIQALFEELGFRQLGDVQHYESAFDTSWLYRLNQSRLIGTLTLFVFVKE